MIYQRVASIVRQDDHIQGCCVIGHADAAILWSVFTVVTEKENKKLKINTLYQQGNHILNVGVGWTPYFWNIIIGRYMVNQNLQKRN